tara:strand:- start:788 stop:985 length:198 start_codon:yes stop_codon:yes gene_type:complete
MKVGDLVSLKMKKTQPPQVPRYGTVVEVWTVANTRVTTIDVMFADENGVSVVKGFSPRLFEVISD